MDFYASRDSHTSRDSYGNGMGVPGFFFENVLYPSCVTLQEGPTGVFQQWGDPGGLTTDSDLGAWEVLFFSNLTWGCKTFTG